MPWGELTDDVCKRKTFEEDAATCGRKESALRRKALASPVAASHWEALLEARKRPRHEQGEVSQSAWGDLEASESKRTAVVELDLGDGECFCADARRLAAGSPVLCALLAESTALSASMISSATPSAPSRPKKVDLTSLGLMPRPLKSLLRLSSGDVSETGKNGDDGLWAGGQPRPVARAARLGEAQQVEDALHALEMLTAASRLGMCQLEATAEERLLRTQDGGIICNATVLPLLAYSFGKHPTVSRTCLRFLTAHAEEVLKGRERQLGVLYATHPVVTTLVTGVHRAVVGRSGADRSTTKMVQQLQQLDRIAMELLFGSGAGGPDALAGLVQAADE